MEDVQDELLPLTHVDWMNFYPIILSPVGHGTSGGEPFGIPGGSWNETDPPFRTFYGNRGLTEGGSREGSARFRFLRYDLNGSTVTGFDSWRGPNVATNLRNRKLN